MHTTSTSLVVQPLLFSFENLSGCFLTAPTYKEKEFMAYWNALVDIVHPSLLNERKRHTGRPGYALMDSGYFSSRIDAFTRTLGKIPVIDGKKCGSIPKPEMDTAKKQRYRARTTVKGTNSELKECFLPKVIYSRGIRAHFEINFAVLLITMKAMRRVLLREQQFIPAA